MKPPGNDRLNILGDKTAEFYLNPKSFIESRVSKHKSSIFQQRFLNKPTIWLTDHNSVNTLLFDKCDSFDQGYDVMNILPQLFGSSCVLFRHGEIVIQLRQILAHSITARTEKINNLMNCLVFPEVDALCKREMVTDLYQSLKEILTKLFLQFFFDIDASKEPELIKTITELSIEHWHGITSIPTSVKLVGHVFQKALSAKKRLTEIFRERLKREGSEPPLVYTEMLSEIDEETAVDHVLVCISALLPKAMASLLTSSLVQMAIHSPLERLVASASSVASSNKQECPVHITGSRGDIVNDIVPDSAVINGTTSVTSFSSSSQSSNQCVLSSHLQPKQSPIGGDVHENGNREEGLTVAIGCVLKEVYRLFPPFFGGRKVANQEIQLGNYTIDKGQAMIYMSYFAHRDVKVFPYADDFLPERWMKTSYQSHESSNTKSPTRVPNLFTFGGGKRECVGNRFTHYILSTILCYMSTHYKIAITEPEPYYSDYKWLPVSRPKNPVRMRFNSKSACLTKSCLRFKECTECQNVQPLIFTS
ncbi:uncharacterized protein LOC142336206 isoform X2 [Convolutriloba macropyga]|uniref:uncharacterized protein LOC142336206 isoform X2 n=1 Tax=Convolutriloba macropyga TaxID=536237 RepID=UPI003F528C17